VASGRLGDVPDRHENDTASNRRKEYPMIDIIIYALFALYALIAVTAVGGWLVMAWRPRLRKPPTQMSDV
jgi:hypothetical protein